MAVYKSLYLSGKYRLIQKKKRKNKSKLRKSLKKKRQNWNYWRKKPKKKDQLQLSIKVLAILFYLKCLTNRILGWLPLLSSSELYRYPVFS
jgi:hypothetical protein